MKLTNKMLERYIREEIQKEGFFGDIVSKGKKMIGMGGLGLEQELDRLETNLQKLIDASPGLKMINWGFLNVVPIDSRIAKRFGTVHGGDEGQILRYIKSRGSGSNWKRTMSVPGAAQNNMYRLAQYLAHGTQSGAMSGYSGEGQSGKDISKVMNKFRSKHAEKFGLRNYYNLSYMTGMAIEHIKAHISKLEANEMGHGQAVKDALSEMNEKIEKLIKNLAMYLKKLASYIGTRLGAAKASRQQGTPIEPVYGLGKTVPYGAAAQAKEWAEKTSGILGIS
tara:strand:- start:4184 stop:5023 length:840 start_codon:yes stop_codon:yes gene_type:complete